MKRAIGILALVPLLVANAAAQTAAKQRMVVLISLDGFPAYDLEDPALPIPVLRQLIASGASARMKTVNPTVTWPNHTTLITGVRPDQHGLLVNGSLVPTGSWPPIKVEPKIEKSRMVHAPTVYDAAHDAGLTSAQVDWVAIHNAATVNWAFPEWASPEGTLEQEMIRKGALRTEDVTNFTKVNIFWRDQIWANAAAFLIKEHKPNLLMVHFLSLDTTHHRYGPKTLAGTAAIAFLDSCVGRIVRAVDDAGMRERTSFFVVSDHGFKAYTKEIHASTALAQAGLGDRAYVLPEGGSALVYLKDGAHDLLPKVAAVLQQIEGVQRVVQPEEYAQLGLPSPEHDPQMGSLFLLASPGYAFSGATGGPVTAEVPQTSGGHGYINTDPEMDAIFIASGYGIRKADHLNQVANVDVAPTIAALLGVQLPRAVGKALPIVDLPASARGK